MQVRKWDIRLNVVAITSASRKGNITPFYRLTVYLTRCKKNIALSQCMPIRVMAK